PPSPSQPDAPTEPRPDPRDTPVPGRAEDPGRSDPSGDPERPGHSQHGTDGEVDQPAEPQREFRAAELAEAAGITTRTLRFYRERKLIPPPRREGRIAWYDEHHLARLRTVTGL